MKITIVTPTYNSAASLRTTFESVLAQTHTDIDYIVIDGNSTDGTVDILKEYAPRFEGRLRWVSEPDNGIYDAMNKGISMASGDVVGILNSDDFFVSDDILERVAANIGDNDAVYGDVVYVDSKDITKTTRYYSSARFNADMLKLGFMPAHPSFYCKRSVYERLGLYRTDITIGSDFEFFIRAYLKDNIKTAYLPMIFVSMRTKGISSLGLQSHFQVMKDKLKALKLNGITSSITLVSYGYLIKLLSLSGYRLKKMFKGEIKITVPGMVDKK